MIPCEKTPHAPAVPSSLVPVLQHDRAPHKHVYKSLTQIALCDMVRSLLLLSLLLAVASRAVAQGWGQNREPASLEVAAALKRADAFFRDNNIKLW